jgi:hypothetical protein
MQQHLSSANVSFIIDLTENQSSGETSSALGLMTDWV